MAAVRFLIAGALLHGWFRARGMARPSRKQWKAAAISGGLLLAGGVVSALYTEGVITDFHSTAKAGTDRARFDGLKNDVESGLLRTNLLYASGSVILATGLVWMYLYPGEAGGTLFGLELRPNGASVHLSMEID
jgi:hypothetical protein